jgi:SnoaL-like polyketide cyclase
MSSTQSQDNKAIVDRWFTEFWGKAWNPQIVEELGAPDILLQYLLQAPRRGRADVKTFMTEFREAFPDLSVTGAADFVCEGDYVVGRWEGWGTHTGPAYHPQKDRGFARGGATTRGRGQACRALLPFAAPCCLERARRGQLPITTSNAGRDA